MNEIIVKKDMTVKEFTDKFRVMVNDMSPATWKLVGIKVFFYDEENEIYASPGIYTKGFDAEGSEEE